MSTDNTESRKLLDPPTFVCNHVAFWALLFLCVLTFGRISPVLAADDNENSTPTEWWMYSGQTYEDIWNTIDSKNARIVDIKADSTLDHYTVTYVQNTGAYAKEWWFWVGIDASELQSHISNTGARLTSLQAYDIGGGNIRFAVSMIANTGSDAKSWWYYYGQSAANITAMAEANNARLTTLESYASNGETLYAFIMIANTGADDKAWWWHANVNAQTITNSVSRTNSRILDMTSAGNGNFNVVMESCSSGCSEWWWYEGYSPNQTITKALDHGARVLAADPYPGCSSDCITAVMISNTPADITACDPFGCISEAQLSANICNALDNQVVGYVCLVGGIRPAFGGLARTSANPPQTSMTPDLVTEIASVSKTMTATAIVQLLANDGLTPDTKIAPYLYTDWKRGPNINQLTFRELLTHTSGFGQISTCGNSATYAEVETLVANGVSASNIGQPSYGNCNFWLLRELMPALTGQRLMNFANGSQRAGQSSALYISHMQSDVFEPVGVTDSSCTPPTTPTGILSYPFPAGSASGTDWGDYSLACGAAGWVLSAFDIFKVVKDLATGNTLLSNSEKQQMFQGCLGWDCSVRPDCPNPYVCKNGSFGNGAGEHVWTYAGILKCDVPVVVVVNSPLPSTYQNGSDIIGLVENAYNSAQVPGTPRSCQ
jgi:hypothetical protein